MIWFVIALIFIISVLFFDKYGRGIMRRDFAEVIFVIAIPLLLAFIIAILFGITCDWEYYTTSHDATKIIALQDNMDIEGGGFIAVNIGTETYYYYYVELEDGSYKMDKIKDSIAYDVIIREENDDNAFLYKYTNHYKIQWNWYAMESGHDSISKYEFRVPEGTIVKQFNLDSN